MSAPVFQHPTTHGAKQRAEPSSIDRLLQIESRSEGKCLLHGLPVFEASHDNDRRGFVPGRLTNQAGQLKSVRAWHIEIEEDSVEPLLIDEANRLLAVADRAHFRFQRCKDLGHQFQTCEIIIY